MNSAYPEHLPFFLNSSLLRITNPQIPGVYCILRFFEIDCRTYQGYGFSKGHVYPIALFACAKWRDRQDDKSPGTRVHRSV
jgi:hypothetical protein